MSTADPYKIIGVSSTATDEEVKKAYRNLARKYHPDVHGDGPLSDLAQDKMQQINAAYDTIVRQRKEGYTPPPTGNTRYRSDRNRSNPWGYDTGRYGQNQGRQTGTNNYGRESRGKYDDIRNLINMGRLYDAESILGGIPVSGRNAEWYYLKGLVYQKKGWFEEAYRHVDAACKMDPNNQEYRAAMEMLSQRRGGSFKGTRSQNSSNICGMGNGGYYQDDENDCGGCCCEAVSCCACMNLMDCC